MRVLDMLGKTSVKRINSRSLNNIIILLFKKHKISLIIIVILLISSLIILTKGNFLSQTLPVKTSNSHPLKKEYHITKAATFNDTLIKTYLLKKNIDSMHPINSQQESRNIFMPLKTTPALPIEIPKDPSAEKDLLSDTQEIIPPIKFKLIGIIAQKKVNPKNQDIFQAVIADGEATYIVSKGDQLLGEYEVIDIGNKNIEIRNIQFNKNDILELND